MQKERNNEMGRREGDEREREREVKERKKEAFNSVVYSSGHESQSEMA